MNPSWLMAQRWSTARSPTTKRVARWRLTMTTVPTGFISSTSWGPWLCCLATLCLPYSWTKLDACPCWVRIKCTKVVPVHFNYHVLIMSYNSVGDYLFLFKLCQTDLISHFYYYRNLLVGHYLTNYHTHQPLTFTLSLIHQVARWSFQASVVSSCGLELVSPW